MPCVSWFLFSAGCENTSKSSVVNNTVTKVFNDVTQTSQQYVSNLVTNWQDIKFINKGIYKCGSGFNISQSLNANMKVANNISSQQASQIKNQLSEQLANDTKTLAQNDPNLWQVIFGKAANTSSITEVTNNLQSEFNNNVKQESIMNVVNSFLNQQNQTITNEGTIEADQCNISQNLLVDIQVSNVLKSIQDSMLSSQVFRDISNKIDTAAKSGGGKGKKSKGKKKTWIWIILIVLLLAFAISLYLKFRGNKQKLEISVKSPPVVTSPQPIVTSPPPVVASSYDRFY